MRKPTILHQLKDMAGSKAVSTAAASYESQQVRGPVGHAVAHAKRRCPDLIVTPCFEVCKAVSQQIREIFAEHTPNIEPLSLDHAYLDVTDNLQNIPLERDVVIAGSSPSTSASPILDTYKTRWRAAFVGVSETGDATTTQMHFAREVATLRRLAL